jgi:hypothetical protein
MGRTRTTVTTSASPGVGASERENLIQRIRSYRTLPENWDGDSSPVPAGEALESAVQLVRALRVSRQPAVSPANEGGVAFEWDLDHDYSVYAYALTDAVAVHAFDNERDYVDIKLPPRAAAKLISALLSANQAS